MTRSLLIGAFVLALLGAGAYLLTQDDRSNIDASVAVAEAMGGDTTGYRRATTVREFTFPRDHGPHPGYKTEWWYYTGNLNAADGRHFGYELTIFRIAMTPPDSAADEPARTDTSDWATDHFYMAHFAVSDVENEIMYDFQRFSRGAAGLAGAQADPFRVWLEDWQASGPAGDTFPMRLRAASDGIGVDLSLTPKKPHVLQGDRGFSQKGPGEGNASYYYSFTRLGAEGTVAINGDTSAVEGLSWMDREWSTSALGENQVGWDWFALQLSDGRDIMYYQIRQPDGTPSPYTEGVIVAEDGSARRIDRGDAQLEVLDTWTNDRGATYPAGWRLQIPSAQIDLTITPYFDDQELDATVRYWEGAVQIDGTADGDPVSGNGYVEMTGYGEGDAQPV